MLCDEGGIDWAWNYVFIRNKMPFVSFIYSNMLHGIDEQHKHDGE